MSSLTSRPNSIGGIKHRADSLRKAAPGLTRKQALDLSAQQAGFHNYAHARRMLSPDATYPLTIRASWYDQDKGLRGMEELTIRLSKPWSELIRLEQLANSHRTSRLYRGIEPDTLEFRYGRGHTQESGRRMVCEAARAFAFMDATGLRPSSGRSRAYPRNSAARYGERAIPGEDHSGVWFDPKTKAYLIVDEPYISTINAIAERGHAARQQWCEQHGYSMAMPDWPGMYNPDGGTRLFLFSSNAKGVPLGPVVAALNALPSPVVAGDWPGTSSVVPARVTGYLASGLITV